MTDLEKFKKLLDDIGIKYYIETDNNYKTGEIQSYTIHIDSDFTLVSWNNLVMIDFDSVGKFIEFEGWGE